MSEHPTEQRCLLCGEPRSAHTKAEADWRTVPGCLGLFRKEPASSLPLVGEAPDLHAELLTALKAIRTYCSPHFQCTNDCNGGDDGPCDCAGINPRDVVDAAIAKLVAARDRVAPPSGAQGDDHRFRDTLKYTTSTDIPCGVCRVTIRKGDLCYRYGNWGGNDPHVFQHLSHVDSSPLPRSTEPEAEKDVRCVCGAPMIMTLHCPGCGDNASIDPLSVRAFSPPPPVSRDSTTTISRASEQSAASGPTGSTRSPQRESVEHELKTWPDYYRYLMDGTKTFEYRRDDRGFKVGDTLYLREWDPTFGRYTGRDMRRRVTYLLNVSKDFVVMSLAIATSYPARFTPFEKGKATGSAKESSSSLLVPPSASGPPTKTT